MTFTSLTFLFIFFPLTVAVFVLGASRKPETKSYLLIAASLIFYGWGDMKALPLLICLTIFNYASGMEMVYAKKTGKRSPVFLMVTSVTVNIGVLAVYKYLMPGMPLGMSFYTFSAVSYLVDRYKDDSDEKRSYAEELLYIVFFPKVVSGPIVRFDDFSRQIKNSRFTWRNGIYGFVTFLEGLMKKVLIADQLGEAFSSIYNMESAAGLTVLMGTVFYSLQLYFDFSGYSDMAIGISRMFGFKFDVNFNYPYISKSLTEFWRRWHISLGNWFKTYVYIPLGGNRCSTYKNVRNLLIVWFLTGIWHGSTGNFIFWGLYHGFFIILEKYVIGEKMERLPDRARVVITDVIVFTGWIFFFSPSVSAGFRWIGRIFGMDGCGLIDQTSVYLIYSNLLLLAVSFLLCSPAFRNMYNRLMYEKLEKGEYLSAVIYVIAFIMCLAKMVGATYTTFLYFKF